MQLTLDHSKANTYGRSGPWDDEPDVASFMYEGLLCTIARDMSDGHLCWYVDLPLGHVWHGVEFPQIPANIDTAFQQSSRWVIGWSADHSGDWSPKAGPPTYTVPYAITYKNWAYAIDAVTRIAKACANPSASPPEKAGTFYLRDGGIARVYKTSCTQQPYWARTLRPKSQTKAVETFSWAPSPDDPSAPFEVPSLTEAYNQHRS